MIRITHDGASAGDPGRHSVFIEVTDVSEFPKAGDVVDVPGVGRCRVETILSSGLPVTGAFRCEVDVRELEE